MNINHYMEKRYQNPPCWQLVADVLINETGLTMPDFTPESAGSVAVAHAFRLALHEGRYGFTQVDGPQEFAVALMYAKKGGTPLHCGIVFQGKILHAMPHMTVWESAFSLADKYKQIEYWRHHG